MRDSLQVESELESLNQVKMVLLDILETFQRVCNENDLRYCAVYGTLLGAVRHSGFIPWDDDIDIAMPREDYDKLKKISVKVFKKPYFFQTMENDPECFCNGYSKLRNSNTAYLEEINKGHNCNQGIAIDILPLDNFPVKTRHRLKQLQKIRYYQSLLYIKVYGKAAYKKLNISQKSFKNYKVLAKLYSHRKLCKKLECSFKSCNMTEHTKLAILTHYTNQKKCIYYEQEYFKYAINTKFENIQIPIPVGYKDCLKLYLGENYMVYPSIKYRKSHHYGIFDANKSYKEYI